MPPQCGTCSQPLARSRAHEPLRDRKITPSLNAIVRIAEALNVSIDHLLVDDIPRMPLHSPSTTSATG
jgi:hypothetical protein